MYTTHARLQAAPGEQGDILWPAGRANEQVVQLQAVNHKLFVS
jgi:hypothetical protein